VDFPGVGQIIFAGEQMWQNLIFNTRN